MKIQLINYSGDNVSSLEVEECNSFGNAVSLDSFDLNTSLILIKIYLLYPKVLWIQ